ncbi:MAG: GNAT family N-acetyltransferase [Pseudonocardia sp.]|nr:GNAT family N-acetyltransferase [Pseudonocardia sp.]
MALWRVHVELEDRPGRLGELATAVGAAGCNILSVHVVGEPTHRGSVTDELLVRVPAGIDPSVLIMAAARVKAPCTLHVPADATELSDPVTTALALARMVAADPGSAPRAVATLLHARLVDPAAAPAPDLHTHPIRVGAQHLLLGRAWPFTATELSRAAALLELSAQLSLTAPAPEPALDTLLLLHDGSQVLLREAGPSDVPLVDALHARCSPESRRARFLSPSPRLDPQQLRALVDPVGGRSILALTRDGGSAVGLADLHLADPLSPTPTATFGVLVEDTWQHRGLGTALVRRVAETAEELGMSELTGTVPADEVRITRLLRRAGLRPTAVLADGTLQLNVPLETPAAMA